jgi:mRNA interferase RelE/StbE
VSLRIEYDERAISHAAAFLDDPPGLREVLDAIDRLADDPRPAGVCPLLAPGPLDRPSRSFRCKNNH